MDGCLDGSKDGYAGRIEVIEGRTGRRQRSEAESLAPGAKVADVARRQVYDWRKKLAAGKLAVPADVMAAPTFAALVIETPSAPPCNSRSEKSQSRIELVVDGVTVRVGVDVDEAQLGRVIRAVRAAGT